MFICFSKKGANKNVHMQTGQLDLPLNPHVSQWSFIISFLKRKLDSYKMAALQRGEKAMGGGKAASVLNNVEGKKEWKENEEREVELSPNL